MKRKLKSLLALALCAVGLSAFAKEPDAVQLWEGGPYWAETNLGDAEQGVPAEYGALYKFNNATNEVAKLGDGWRLPTEEEFGALISNCGKGVWTNQQNGVYGRLFTGTGDYASNSIFLPAAGNKVNNGRENAGDRGYYWSSKMKDTTSVKCLYFDKDNGAKVGSYSRSIYLSVRAVRDTPPPPPALAVANVTTATHWPWDGKIDVTCDLTGSGKVQLSAALTTNGVTVCTAKAENVTGATTINLDAAGGVTNGVKFVWNAKADCPAGFNSKDTKVKVTAKKVVPPAGALPSEFSVSATKKVHFSQGNLVATIDATGAPTAWKFAANQYDYIGNATANTTIGSTAGDIDLFGWSTASTTYGISTSNTAGDYSGDFVDWGKNIGDGNTWRTLTTAEWQYLFNYGDYTSDVRNGKYKWATVNGVNGYVIAPDDFSGELANTYADDAALAANNLVFLPAAGRRGGSSVSGVGDGGYYWSSAANGSNSAYYVSLKSDDVTPDNHDYRSRGYCVRLVTEVK